jgi:hypothetical protein
VTVRLILDSSALEAYVSDDVPALDIAELLVTVAEAGDVTAIPALCLIATHRTATVEQRVRLIDLAADDDGHTLVLPLLAADVPGIAELALSLPVDQAQAAAAAVTHGAVLATYHRTSYPPGTIHDDDILDL